VIFFLRLARESEGYRIERSEYATKECYKKTKRVSLEIRAKKKGANSATIILLFERTKQTG
jgi:hypothetical protein